MGGWGNQTFIRMSRGQAPVKRDDIPVGFRLDNIRWAPDGSLFAAGQEPSAGALTMATSRVIKIDPNTLKVQDVIRYPFNDVFNFSTVAVQVGREIWVGSVRGDKIARFPMACDQGVEGDGCFLSAASPMLSDDCEGGGDARHSHAMTIAPPDLDGSVQS
jgi:hypothetical protein